jgi:hypothetical protein
MPEKLVPESPYEGTEDTNTNSPEFHALALELAAGVSQRLKDRLTLDPTWDDEPTIIRGLE